MEMGALTRHSTVYRALLADMHDEKSLNVDTNAIREPRLIAVERIKRNWWAVKDSNFQPID